MLCLGLKEHNKADHHKETRQIVIHDQHCRYESSQSSKEYQFMINPPINILKRLL